MPPYFSLYLLTACLALVVQGGQVYPPILPDLPPPPTFTPVVNNSLTLIVGESATLRVDQQVIIDCQPLIIDLMNKGISNPRVTWFKNEIIVTNGSERNIAISKDRRFCIITETGLSRGGELGTSGNYTCRVCDGNGTNCINDTSSKIVCGVPHLVPPANPPLVLPIIISLECGQDVTVPTLVGVSSIIITCNVYNGTEPFTTTVHKDGTMVVGNSVPHIITSPTDDDFGTYTVVVSTEHCGAVHAVSRILREGFPPDIDKGPFVPMPPNVTIGSKRVSAGSPVYVFSGSDVIIDCNIVNGTAPITILWLRNNKVINSSVGNSSTVTITDAEDDDVFTCRANNSIGFDEASTIINIESRCSVTNSLKDVVFVIDTSGSIGSSHFQLIREFTANITTELMRDSPSSAVGVILFGSTAHIEFNLQTHNNLSELLTAINELPYSGGNTDTAKALNLLLSTAQNEGFGLRNDSSKVAIVITDGKSSFPLATLSAVSELHASNIFDVLAVGIDKANMIELHSIASSPELVMFTNTFNSTGLQQLKDKILLQLCIDIAIDTNGVSSTGSLQSSCNTSYVLAPDNKTCISNNTDCIYMINKSSGSINTDGFPNISYAANSNCTWIIDLPAAYKSIELEFDEMAIEESPDCAKDRVTILNGKGGDALSLGSYCGNQLPATIKSSTQAVTIRFISDDTVNGKGFNLRYKGLTERSEGVYECGIIIQNINITIALPSFPSKYSSPINCVYYFQSLMQRIKLTFLYLDILAADCNTDRIEIYEGINADVPSRKICSGNRVVEFTSTSDIIKMKYLGNSIDTYQGFHALVTFL